MKRDDDDLDMALLEHFYGDEKLDFEDTETAARLHELKEVLEIVDQAPVPSRPEGYGAQVWQRLESQLPSQNADSSGRDPVNLSEARPSSSSRTQSRRTQSRRPRSNKWRRFGRVAAALVLLLVGFLAGRQRQAESPQLATLAEEVEINDEARDRLLFAALGRHLGRTERLLTEISNTEISKTSGDEAPETPGSALEELSEQDWAGELLRTNRLYRQAAQRAGQARLVSLLTELEPILLELAHAPASDELQDLQRRVDEKSLLFKVRVTEGRLAARRSPTA